jgi:hypothetical protein
MEKTIMNATTSALFGSREGIEKCQKFQRSLARPPTFTPGFAKGSLSRYADELFRRLEERRPLTLAEYARAEEILSTSPSRHLAATRPGEGMTQYGLPIEPPQPTDP